MTSLFKLKPISERLIENIAQKLIWVPKAKTLNDPFDCFIFPYLDRDITAEYELSLLLDKLTERSQLFSTIKSAEFYEAKTTSELNSIAHERVCERILDIGVCSFLDSYSNIVTWSHYGDQHRGVCLEYLVLDGDHLFKRVFNGYMINRVSYTNIKPFISWRDFLRAPEMALNICFSTKFSDWAYENETRIITFNKSGDCLIPISDLGLKLVRIYKGCKCEQNELWSRMERHCEANGIDIVELRQNGFEFEVKKNP